MKARTLASTSEMASAAFQAEKAFVNKVCWADVRANVDIQRMEAQLVNQSTKLNTQQSELTAKATKIARW